MIGDVQSIVYTLGHATNRTPHTTWSSTLKGPIFHHDSSLTVDEAMQNVDPASRNVLDPSLTEQGELQAKALARTFPYHDRVEAVFSSPLQRALQTALLAFHAHLSPMKKLIAQPLAQETSVAPCDTGNDRSSLETTFGTGDIDFGSVGADWNSKSGKWSQNEADVLRRAADLRDLLAARVESEIVLVTHGYFLRYLTEV